MILAVIQQQPQLISHGEITLTVVMSVVSTMVTATWFLSNRINQSGSRVAEQLSDMKVSLAAHMAEEKANTDDLKEVKGQIREHDIRIRGVEKRIDTVRGVTAVVSFLEKHGGEVVGH